MTTLAAPPVTSLFASIRPGDRVSILSPHGTRQTGRCVMKFSSHAVLNLGGRFGTPGIATDLNVCDVSPARARPQQP